MGLLTAPTVKKFEFHKSKMADGRHFKNRYIIIIIIVKGIYIAQVRKGHKCAMSAEMAVWLRNCLCLCSYLHNYFIKIVKQKCLQLSSGSLIRDTRARDTHTHVVGETGEMSTSTSSTCGDGKMRM